MAKQTIHYHKSDLPDGVRFETSVAVDTETMGLELHRDRLCVLQLSVGDGAAHIIQFHSCYEAYNLKKVLTDPTITKIFHYGRFDLAAIQKYLGVRCMSVYDTYVASRLTRTYGARHSLKALCLDLLGVEIDKKEQTSDWGTTEDLTATQLEYAANDVLHLHSLRERLDVLLKRERREEIAGACFGFLPFQSELDLLGGGDVLSRPPR